MYHPGYICTIRTTERSGQYMVLQRLGSPSDRSALHMVKAFPVWIRSLHFFGGKIQYVNAHVHDIAFQSAALVSCPTIIQVSYSAIITIIAASPATSADYYNIHP
jgi:hypothetical protein